MKQLFGPAQIGALVLAVLGLVIGQPALAVAGIAAWIGIVAVKSIRSSKPGRHSSEYSSESRALLRPLQSLRSEVATIVQTNSTNPTIKVIGGQALEEADAMIARAESIVASLDDLKRVAKGLRESGYELEKLEARLKESDSEAEKASFAQAIEVRKTEIASYTKVQQGLEAAKTRLRDAETALLAIKAQLTAAALGGESDVLDTEGLAGMVGRLSSLSTSLEEVEQMRDEVK